MSDSVYLGLKARQLEDSPAYQPISCVKLTIGGEEANGNPIVCQAGNPKAGRTIETSNPLIWDSAMGNTVAQNILSAVQGYAYKPFTADGAIVNPAVEIGDAVEVGDVYSVIADVETTFSPLMSATISAPVGSDIDHEYPYESSESYAQRRIAAELGQLKTEFIVQNGEVSWAISQIGAVDQEGSIWNKLTSVKTTVDGITVRTEKDVQTIIGTTEIKWAKVDVTPEQIKTEVAEYFDAAGAADTAYDNALADSKTYTNGKIAPIEGQYTSAIEQSAKQIMATVAAAETIWDTSTLSQTIQNNIATYGYGTPPNSTASQYNGKYYLDQTNGTLYKSNGSRWTKQSTQLQTIQTTMNSAITLQSNRITSVVNSVTTLGNRVTAIEQTDSDITLSVYSNQNGTTYFKLSDGSGEIQTSEFNFTTDIVNVAGNLAAKYIAAEVSIYSPNIYGGSISSGSFIGGAFMDANRDAFLSMFSAGGGGILYYGPSSRPQSQGNGYFQVTGLASGSGSNAAMYLGGTAMGSMSNGVFYPTGVWDFSYATVRGLSS